MVEAKQRLAELLKSHNFRAKRNWFYRIINNQILQSVKFEYEPWLSWHELRIGLYSLYSELNPHWLTPGGCITKYPVLALSNNSKAAAVSLNVSPNIQLDALQEYGIPWLDAMHTQRDLVDAMCEIEIRESGRIMWIDSFKLAPFLISGDYDSADRVIASILQQHAGPAAWTSVPWIEADFKIYQTHYPGEDSELIQVHEWIRDREYNIIESYLQENFVKNTKLLRI